MTADTGTGSASAPPRARVEVVDVDPDDAAALARWALVPATGFMEPRPDDAGLERRRQQVLGQRLRGGTLGGALVGSLRSFDTELTLPGGRVVAADAVSSVAVLPTHRRRGVLTAMMGTDLHAARERGQVVSVLIASEAAIYGRYGFGPATAGTSWVLDTGRARFRDDAPADGGTLELVEPAAARAELRAVHDRARRARAGGLLRDERWWDLTTGAVPGGEAWEARSRTVLRRGPDGAADGYCTYTPLESSRGRVSTATARVHDLTATTPQALRALWELCASVDLVREVRADDRPADEVLPWLLADARAAQRTAHDDFLWVRVLDPVAALGARGYGADGRLVLRVHDAGGPAAGTFALEVSGGAAQVTAGGGEPDVELGAAALGSLLLGGTSAAVLARAGLLRAADGTALERTARAFATAEAPWCPTRF